MARPMNYNVFAKEGSILVEIELDTGDKLKLDLSPDQAAHLCQRLAQALEVAATMSAPIAVPN